MVIPDKAFGSVVVCGKSAPGHLFLLIKQKGGYWSFPKGHVEGDEKPLETAKRELREETGITAVHWQNEQLFSVEYQFNLAGKEYLKTSSYFLAFVEEKLKVEPLEEFKNEIIDIGWFSYDEAKQLLNYPPAIKILDQVEDFLKTKQNHNDRS